MMQAEILRKRWLMLAMIVWAMSVAYFAFVVAPLIDNNMRIVSQTNDFMLKYIELIALRARHAEAAAKARADAMASPRPATRIDSSHDIRATISRLAMSHHVAIRALRRGSATQTQTQTSAQESCASLPIALSGAWRDYLAFRARLIEQVAERAAFITREVIKPLKERRVAVNLTIRACSRQQKETNLKTSEDRHEKKR